MSKKPKYENLEDALNKTCFIYPVKDEIEDITSYNKNLTTLEGVDYFAIHYSVKGNWVYGEILVYDNIEHKILEHEPLNPRRREDAHLLKEETDYMIMRFKNKYNIKK